MNVSQMQALEYFFNRVTRESHTSSSYQIIFSINNTLFTGNFFQYNDQGIPKSSDFKTDGLGELNQYAIDINNPALRALKSFNKAIFGIQDSFSEPTLFNFSKNTTNSAALFYNLYPVLESITDINDSPDYIFNLESIDGKIKLPFIKVKDTDTIDWVSLNIQKK